MKQFLLLFLLTNVLIAYSQNEVSSFYFSSYISDSTQVVQQFDKKIVGQYALNEDGYNQMVISEDSIYIKSGTPIIMTLNEAKAKGYTIENDKLKGLDKNKPLHCKVHNDTVFTIYYQEDTYFSSSKGDKMTKIKNGYLLSIKEKNGFYSFFYIEKEGNDLIVKSIDHENQMSNIYKFSTLYTQYLEGIKTYVANPILEEVLLFYNQKGFNEKSVFKLIKS